MSVFLLLQRQATGKFIEKFGRNCNSSQMPGRAKSIFHPYSKVYQLQSDYPVTWQCLRNNAPGTTPEDWVRLAYKATFPLVGAGLPHKYGWGVIFDPQCCTFLVF